MCTAVPFALASRASNEDRIIAAVGTYLLVLAQARSSLSWVRALPGGKVIRRCLRIAVYLLPSVIVGVPFIRVRFLAVLLAIIVGALGIYLELREVRTSLSRRYLRLLPRINALSRRLDILFFALAGAAQEYLYRGLILTCLISWPFLAVAVSTLLFVVEHLAQAGPAGQWDRKDIILQILLSVSFAVIVVIWRSLPAAMIGHTVFNSPNVIQAVKRPGVTPPKLRESEKIA
jgi:hypothetical protein